MQQYRWKAVDSSGVSRSGVYSAASEFEAAAFVRSNYGYLTLLQAEKPASARVKKQGLFKFSKTKNGLSDEEKTVFFSQLALMLNSGLPLLKSLSVLAERLPPKTAQLCLGIERDLKMGTSFAGCIKTGRRYGAHCLRRWPKQVKTAAFYAKCWKNWQNIINCRCK